MASPYGEYFDRTVDFVYAMAEALSSRDTYRQLRALTLSNAGREAILIHLQDMEDIALAGQEFRDIAAGKARTYSLEEMLKANDLAVELDRAGAPKLREARPANKKAPPKVSR